MANVIIEYLKKKFAPKDKYAKLNELSNASDMQFYDSMEHYEWVDRLREKQAESVKRKY